MKTKTTKIDTTNTQIVNATTVFEDKITKLEENNKIMQKEIYSLNAGLSELYDRVDRMSDVIRRLSTQVIVTDIIFLIAIVYLFIRG